MPTLSTKIENLTSIGKKIAPKLKKLGLETAGNLLFYYPFRWEDWSQIKNIAELEPNTTATIKGQIELIANKRSQWKKRLITEAIIADETDNIKAIWFHQPYLTRNLKPGDQIFLSGKVEMKSDGLQFVHPSYEKITRYKTATTHTARIVPIYPLTKNVTAKQIRYLMSQIISLADQIPDWLPTNIISQNKLVNLNLALKQIHFPDNQTSLNGALERIKFNELFLIQLRAAVAKRELDQAEGYAIKFKKEATQNFVDSLPFKLTKAQKISAWEILQDLEKSRPMNRLLEGDVGSGKTVVAGLAVFNCFLNKFQAAYMAPTEILAQQHFNSFSQLFKKWPVRIGLLTGSEAKIAQQGKMSTVKKADLQKQINQFKIDLAIGTHALIQDKVNFNKLALVIIDEQHRFGIAQRKKLKQKTVSSQVPHFFSMTATPIPRSLALTAYGDLDLSVIDEIPPGRRAVITEAVDPDKRPAKYEFILEQIKAGRQVFVICPLIDPSDKLGVKAVKDEYKKLNEKIFPDIPIGLMHGQLKAKEKEQVMRDFLDKKTKIMVSTPVIEVGIDVPNATIMLIESAERFGLAQLHQFRGRVGRGQYQSYCFLLSESNSVEVIKRLHTVVKSNDGFALAERDLEFRGPGEVYGLKQSGYKDELKVAKLTDYIIIKKAKNTVDALIKTDPTLGKFPAIKAKLEQFEKSVHFE